MKREINGDNLERGRATAEGDIGRTVGTQPRALAQIHHVNPPNDSPPLCAFPSFVKQEPNSSPNSQKHSSTPCIT